MANRVLIGVLVVFFIIGGVVNLIAPKFIVDDFVRWGYPRWFPILTGGLELATAPLLAFPDTRRMGIALGSCVMLAAAGTVVLHREYLHAMGALVVLVLMALVGTELTV